jgi:hypothetical protein
MQPGHTRCTTRKRSTTAPSAQPTHLRASRKNNPRSPGNVPALSRQKSHASRALRNRRAAKPANTPHTTARTIMSLIVHAAGAKSKTPKSRSFQLPCTRRVAAASWLARSDRPTAPLSDLRCRSGPAASRSPSLPFSGLSRAPVNVGTPSDSKDLDHALIVVNVVNDPVIRAETSAV